jgi:hypothetical protein
MVALMATAALGAGCSLFESEPEYDTVTDHSGRYHILVPSGWQSIADSAILAVYASETLPEEGESLDVLSIVVLAGEAVEDAAPAQMISDFVAARGENREWTEAVISEASTTTVGTRDAAMVEVSAVDSQGAPFQGRFVQVRTSGTDYIIAAIMPGEEWGEAAAEVDGVLERWYWHVPDDSTADDPATAESEEADSEE